MFVGLVVATPVARRPRIGAGRLRAVAQRAGLVDPRERAAAGADREHLDRREADRVAVLDEPLLRHALLALVDERDVGARAAHVEADRVREAAERRDVAAGDRARGDARRGQADREALRAAWASSRRRRSAGAAGRRRSRCSPSRSSSRLDVARRRAARARRWRRSSRSARARRSPAAPRPTSRRSRPAAPPRGSRASAARAPGWRSALMKQTATVWTPRRRRMRGDLARARPRRAASRPRRRESTRSVTSKRSRRRMYGGATSL